MTYDQCMPRKEIIATVITHRGRLALFKRSNKVTGDNGNWHCITGFLDPNQTPILQAMQEIHEEAGIPAEYLTLKHKSTFQETDHAGNTWLIHSFHFDSQTEHITLNWENDEAKWIFLGALNQYPTVDWLESVFNSLSGMVANLGLPRSDSIIGWA